MLGRGMMTEIFAVDPNNPDSEDSTDSLHVATVRRRGDKTVLQSHADAAFIVTACNAHAQLVEAVKMGLVAMTHSTPTAGSFTAEKIRADAIATMSAALAAAGAA